MNFQELMKNSPVGKARRAFRGKPRNFVGSPEYLAATREEKAMIAAWNEEWRRVEEVYHAVCAAEAVQFASEYAGRSVEEVRQEALRRRYDIVEERKSETIRFREHGQPFADHETTTWTEVRVMVGDAAALTWKERTSRSCASDSRDLDTDRRDH